MNKKRVVAAVLDNAIFGTPLPKQAAKALGMAKKFDICVGYLDEQSLKPEKRKTWWEHYVEVCEHPTEWAKNIIASFNDTLRPGERARELIAVYVVNEEVKPEKHAWMKTNLVTLHDGRNGIHDKMRCINCGITGKRFRLNGEVTRDSKYRARVYAQCDTTQEHLAKKREGKDVEE